MTGVQTCALPISITATTAGGKIDIAFTASTTVAALLANVGSSDATLTFTWARTAITGTLAGTISVSYTARNSNGSITPYCSGLSNS